MTTRLDGKAIVITGSGRGIGAATAKLAASLGARVVVNDVDADCAEQTAAEIRTAGGQAVVQPADITKWDQAKALIDRAVKEWGRIDGLFNNAGVFRMARFEDTDEAIVRSHMEVNVLGSFACAHAAIQHMKRQGSGSIVNVTSGAHMGLVGMGAYGASKGAVASATYAWAAELAGTRIRVNALSPMAQTRMIEENARFNNKAPGAVSVAPPGTNSPVVCFLMSDAAEGVSGQIVRIEGRALSLVAHPAVALPILDGDWTVDAVAQAFRDDLGKRQFPTGVMGVDITVKGGASELWAKRQ